MEITFDTILSLLGLFIGGGGGAFFTWRWMRRKAKAEAQTEEVRMAQAVQDTYQEMLEDKNKEVADNQRLIAELREDRDHYKQGYIEMRNRQDKTEEMVRDLQMQVARNGRMVEAMRPFLCYDTKCKKRVLVRVSECAETDIEPINHDEL
jgi:hypothetical protein